MKNNKHQNKFLILFTILLVLPFFAYMLKFGGQNISNDNNMWAQFGTYLNGTFVPIIALTGIAITYYLGILSEKRNIEQSKIINDKHANDIILEKIKNKPMLYISYWDGREKIELKICNKGLGPLLVTSYKILNNQKEKTFNSIYDAVADIENNYDDYSGNQKELVLAPNEDRVLLSFELNEKKDKNSFDKDRLKIRKSLKDLKFQVEYQDIYKDPMPLYEKELSWFGRP